MEVQFENKEICKKCGFCCQKCGCDYASDDFEKISYDFLYSVLMEGNISIVSFFDFKELSNGKLIANPFLYLRARNKNRPIVDLLSMKTECSQLGPNGCKYNLQNRPSGGVNLIPMEDNKCYSLKDPKEIVLTWDRYQNVLSRLVKRITGNSIYAQLSLDVENLFYDILNKNYAGVSKTELVDVARMIPFLSITHSEEYRRANKKFNENNKIKLKIKEF